MKFAAQSLLLVFLAATFAHAQNQPNNIPQVQHVIVVIQENRTPTNLFHEDANLITNGAHVQPPNNQGACGTVPTTPPPDGACVPANHNHMTDYQITLTGLPLASATGAAPQHEHYPDWYCTYKNGKMDGACHVFMNSNDPTGCPIDPTTGLHYIQYCPYTYVANTPINCTTPPCPGILDPYFHIAEQYGFANWMFETGQGPSGPAHLFLFAGTSAPDKYNGDNGQFWQYFVSENIGNGGLPGGCIAPSGASAPELPPAPPQNPPEGTWYQQGYPCWNPNTLADLLDAKSVSWRYYDSPGTNGADFWNAPVSIQHICQPEPPPFDLPGNVCQGPDYNNKVLVGNPGRVLNDLGAGGSTCDLQAVTWVIPDGNWSDHPGYRSTDAGPSWVAAIVNAVNNHNNDGSQLRQTPCSDTVNHQQVPYSQDTVVIVVWDDWGGWYDDVLPWRCGSNGVCNGFPGQLQSADYVYGFRVPLLVVGAYVKQVTPQGGYISGTPGQGGEIQRYVHDFGSILNFIEYAFGTGGNPLGGTGGISPSYFYADWLAPDGPNAGCTTQQCPYGLSDFFNFTQTPRNPVWIQGYQYNTSCFLNPTTCFPNYPADPDNDAIDND